VEKFAQLALLNQTIRVTLDCWPRAARFDLPVSPLLDAMAVTITADGEAFDAFGVTTGLRPAVRYQDERPGGEIVIEYTAGFGETPDDIPGDLQHAIMDQVSCAFDTSGALDPKITGAIAMSPQMARIAARYRRVAL
jgi:uncharacterized phiE125 gp8 family phage protein